MSADNVDALREAIVGTDSTDAWSDIERIFRAHYAQLAQVIARLIRDPARAEELAVEVCLRWSANRRAASEHAERWLYRAAVQTGRPEDGSRFHAERCARQTREAIPISG